MDKQLTLQEDKNVTHLLGCLFKCDDSIKSLHLSHIQIHYLNTIHNYHRMRVSSRTNPSLHLNNYYVYVDYSNRAKVHELPSGAADNHSTLQYIITFDR